MKNEINSWFLLIFLFITMIQFKPPGLEERLKAIGPVKDLSTTMQKALQPDSDFQPVAVPGPNDWLANHVEKGQTFQDFVHARFHKPEPPRTKIYLQPIGDFTPEQSPPLDLLKEFTTLFFNLEVSMLPVLSLEKARVTFRINQYTKKRQILTGDILSLLLNKLPADAFCIVGITMEDLYPAPEWNFVFGQASLWDRVGVFSFARYDPQFYGESRDQNYQTLLLKRSCKVLAHEIGHMFGLHHCIYFKCLMNGSNHLAESDARPMHLCPVCLRKLQYSVGFDVVDRYEKLQQFYEKVNFNTEARWLGRRLQKIKSVR